MKLKYKCAICDKEFMRLKPHLLTKMGVLRHSISLKEYYDTYIEPNIVHKCIICGKEIVFNEELFKYEETCSKACNYKLRYKKCEEAVLKKYGCKNVFQIEEVKNKIKNVNIEKYGVENPRQSLEIGEKIKQTNLKKYGCEYGFSNEEIKNKIKQTNLKIYGYECTLSSPECRTKGKETKKLKYGNENFFNVEKSRQTKLERYGRENYINVEKIKETKLERYGNENYVNVEKIKETLQKKYGCEIFSKTQKYRDLRKIDAIKKFYEKYNTEDYDILKFDSYESEFHHKVCNKNFIIKRQLLHNRTKSGEVICTCCNPLFSNISKGEKQICDYIRSFSIDVEENNRTILKNNKELDIVIPSHNLAIEFNGIFWHNELKKDKYEHYNKTKECKEKGIQLIHIFEDEWYNAKEIIKSKIKSSLNLNDRIFARNTKCKPIEYEISEEFLFENHIEGNVKSNVQYGLFHNNELVAVMTFNVKNDECELLRYCSKIYTNVIGGASKLFKHFIDDYKIIKQVYTYGDNRYNTEKLYQKIGFIEEKTTDVDYFYVDKGVRENKSKYTKKKLEKEGYNSSDESIHEFLLRRKIYRIYDCGKTKYMWKRNSVD